MSMAASLIRVIDLLDRPKIYEDDIEQIIEPCSEASIEFEHIKGEKGGNPLH